MLIHLGEFPGVLLDVSIKAAVLAFAAAMILRVFRVRDASLQHCAWTAVLAAMLSLPLIVYVAPNVSVPIASYPNPGVPVESLAPVPGPAATMPVELSLPTPTEGAAMIEPALEPNLPENIPGPAPVEPADVRIGNLLPKLLLAVYIAGVGWFGVRLFIGIWRAKQLASTARPIDLPSLRRQLIGRTSVCQSSQVHVPLTVGWWRPTILLPVDWPAWDDAMLTAVLSHEMEHVRRRDPWISLLAELNRTLYWFHPVAWFLRRRLSMLAEAACDDAVVASSGDRTGYARHLLTVAGRLTDKSRRLAPVGVAMARTCQVEHRVNAILDSSRPLARRLNIATILAILVVAVPLATLTAGLKASDEQSLSTTPTPIPTPVAGAPTFKAGWSAPTFVAPNTAEFALLSAGPIRELKSDGGGRAFEFAINVPKGRKFGITFGEWPITLASPIYSGREKESEGPTTATLRMKYLSNSKAKQRDDVLLSDDQWMEFSLKVPGSYPPDVTHIAGVPLRNVPPAEKKVILISPDSPLAKANTGIRLLLVVRKDQNPKTAAEVETIEPRGELIVSLDPVEKPKPKPKPLEQLAESWRQSEGGVGTLFVRYQHIIGMQDWLKPIALEAVRKIVRDAAAHNLKPDYGMSATDADQSHRFVEEIFRSAMNDEFLKTMNGKPVRMAQSDFRMVGIKRMNILGTRAGERPYFIQLYDGDVALEYDVANKQLNVQNLGISSRMVSMPIKGPNDFRTIHQTSSFIPIDIDKMLASAATKELPDGRLLVSFSGVEVVANPQNGFVERFTLPRMKDPRVMDTNQEILQFGPKTFPGNVTFPRAHLVFDYQEGKLQMIQVVTNDELKVNEGFGDSDFVMKLPAGTKVLDYRKDDFLLDIKQVDVEILDAAAYAKTHVAKSTHNKEHSAPPANAEPAKALPTIPVATPAMPQKGASSASPGSSVPGHQVRGRVVMRSDGKSVANADVLLFAFRDNGNRIESKKTKCDATGEFVFENIAAGAYQLVGSAENYSSRHAQFKGQPIEVPIAQPVTLSLDKMPSIAIQVVAKADGKPVQGAIIRPAYGGHERDQRTDENGRAALRTLTHEVWNIEVEAKNFAKQQQAVSLANTETAEIKFEMQPGGVLFGTVKDEAGQPLAGAGISVFPADHEGGQLAYMRTNSTGQFQFEYMPLDRALAISPSKQGYLDGRQSVALKGAVPVKQEVNLVLKRRTQGGSIAGTVSNSQGKPIAGAVISNQGRSSRDMRKVTTDASGHYRIDDVFEGSIGYELIAKAKGYAPQRLKFKPGTAEAPKELPITMETGHRIRGRIVDEAGKAVTGASIYHSDGDRGGNMEFGGKATTDADGRFAFDSLPKDSPFNIRADSYSEIEGAKLALDGDEEVVVTLKSEGVIKGRLVDAATGKPIERFNVQITFSPDRKNDEPGHHLSGARSTTPEGERFANPDGTLLIKDLIRDMPLQVTVTADGYERKVERRVVAAGAADAKVVEIRLAAINPAKAFTIRGRIVDAQNRPVAGAQLQFISAREIRIPTRRQTSYVEYPFGWQMIRSGNTATAAGLKQLMKTVSGTDGAFEFKDVQPAPEMQVAYWGNGLSQGRLEKIEKLSAEDCEKIVIKTVTPATIRGMIDRNAFPDVTSIEVSSIVMKIDDDWFSAEVSGSDTSYEIKNLPPGKYLLRVLGERVRNEHPDGFTYKDLQRRSIEVKPGETLTFDIKDTTTEK